jgi:hypothetical protein
MVTEVHVVRLQVIIFTDTVLLYNNPEMHG